MSRDIIRKLSSKSVSVQDRKELIASLQSVVGSKEQLRCEVKHHFAPDVYVREIFMPAESIIIGKTHKTKHLNVILRGEVTVFTATEGRKTYSAPCTFVSDAMVKKVVFNHTDCIWQTIHPTAETDLLTLEEMLICEDEIVCEA